MLGRLRVSVAQVLSAPIYLVYEGFMRAVNARSTPLPAAMIDQLAPFFADLDLTKVRCVEAAWIPSGHGGVTFGSTMMIARRLDPDNRSDVSLVAHELVHVRQAVRFGRVGMARRYGVEWFRIISYVDHPFEIEARRYEAHVTSQLVAG